MTTSGDLRSEIADIETRQVQLTAERDELAFEAIVERDKKAVARVADINAELAKLTIEIATLNAALGTAIKRDREAKAVEVASQKRADLAKAEAMLPEVEQLARQIDEAMATLQIATKAFDDKWAVIKKLSGGGPGKAQLGVILSRSLRVGLRGLPGIIVDLVPPNERHSAAEINAGWEQQVRNLAATSSTQTKAANAAA